jgi:hypothetical protein
MYPGTSREAKLTYLKFGSEKDFWIKRKASNLPGPDRFLGRCTRNPVEAPVTRQSREKKNGANRDTSKRRDQRTHGYSQCVHNRQQPHRLSQVLGIDHFTTRAITMELKKAAPAPA